MRTRQAKCARDDRVYCIQNFKLNDYLMFYPITYFDLKITRRDFLSKIPLLARALGLKAYAADRPSARARRQGILYTRRDYIMEDN